MPENLDKNLKLELYKQLKQESNIYIKEIPGIWLQKFALTGAVIVFTIAKNSEQVDSSKYEYLFEIGLILIPLIAIALDAKVLEFSLHARIISQYITETFQDSKVVPEWENLFWGKKDALNKMQQDEFQDELRLAKIRNSITVFIQAVPTFVLIIFCSIIFLGMIWENKIYTVSFGLFAGVIYLSFVYFMWQWIFNQKSKSPVSEE